MSVKHHASHVMGGGVQRRNLDLTILSHVILGDRSGVLCSRHSHAQPPWIELVHIWSLNFIICSLILLDYLVTFCRRLIHSSERLTITMSLLLTFDNNMVFSLAPPAMITLRISSLLWHARKPTITLIVQSSLLSDMLCCPPQSFIVT